MKEEPPENSEIIKPPSHLIKFYLELQKDLEKIWGERSIVLLQNGKFYEIYQVDSHGKAEIAAKCLYMQISLKNGSNRPHSIDNPYMVGFPQDKLSNHLHKLLRHNLVVAIYEQISLTGCSKKGYRYLKTYSPSVYIDDESPDKNYLLALEYTSWICPIKGIELNGFYSAMLDLNTGESSYIESLDQSNNKKAEADLYRIINSYKPKEIIVNDSDLVKKLNKDICGATGDNNIIVRDVDPKWRRPSYQEEIFKKIFKDRDNILSYLKLDSKPEISTLFVVLYSYAWSFDKDIVKRLKFPVDIGVSDFLLLNRDTVEQMHLFTDDYPLFNILNRTKTPMGERLLHFRLLNPFLDPNKIETIYQQTEYFINQNNENLVKQLKTIGDLEKRSRLMLTGTLKSYQIPQIYDSIVISIDILKEYKDLFNIDKKTIKGLKRFIEKISETFELNLLRKKNIGNYFIDDEELINYEKEILDLKSFFYEFAESLSDIIDPGKKSVTVDSTDRDGYYLKTTKTRAKKIKDLNINIKNINITYDDLYLEILSNSVKIKSRRFQEINTKINSLENKLNDLVEIKYKKILEVLTEEFYDYIVKTSDAIAEIDFVQSSAYISKERGYTKPIILSEPCIDTKKLRHPIIEIISDKEYIPNDISIKNTGMLIYGINAVGKSSLLRAVGTAVIMAQAGLYVAAERFRYGIYKKIISKISTSDSMSSGKSTYMMELEQISDMVNADSETLVISDELCCSTETESAHALVASVLELLIKNNSTFIFSTHLRDLQFYDLNLKIMHMDAEISEGKLTSSRILKDGGITETYGLELASAWGMDRSLIKRAFQIRDGDHIVSTKVSRYNKDLYMDSCKLCGNKNNLHTHHIREQSTADSRGMIDGRFHKNRKFNLLVVCEDCHKKIHS